MSYNLMESELDNKNGTIRKYMYVENNNMIYKFELEYDYIDIVNSIEEYISIVKEDDFIVKSELDLLAEGLPRKYFPYRGKYRLKGRYRTTENYLVPKDTRLLKILFLIQKTSILEEINLLKLKNEYKLARDDNNDVLKNFIVKFILKVNFKLIEQYSVEEIKNCLNCLDKISMETKYSRTHLHLSKILSTAKQNAIYFEVFGLNNKFINCINKNKENETHKVYRKHN